MGKLGAFGSYRPLLAPGNRGERRWGEGESVFIYHISLISRALTSRFGSYWYHPSMGCYKMGICKGLVYGRDLVLLGSKKRSHHGENRLSLSLSLSALCRLPVGTRVDFMDELPSYITFGRPGSAGLVVAGM